MFPVVFVTAGFAGVGWITAWLLHKADSWAEGLDFLPDSLEILGFALALIVGWLVLLGLLKALKFVKFKGWHEAVWSALLGVGLTEGLATRFCGMSFRFSALEAAAAGLSAAFAVAWLTSRAVRPWTHFAIAGLTPVAFASAATVILRR